MSANATALRNRLIGRARLRHLQVLVRVAELGSVKRAADAVGLTQPAVTHALTDLEALLDSKLFLRHARGMRPTPMGLALLPLARRILAGIDDSAERVAAMTDRATGVVRVCAITAAISGLLVRALPPFGRRHPEVLVRLREADPLQQAAMIADGEVDLALCRAPDVTPEGWRFAPLMADRFAVVAGPGHPLLRRTRVELEALRGATWLLAPVPTAARQTFDRLFADGPTPPRTSPVITNVSAMFWAMMTQEQLLCLLPVSFARQLIDAGQVQEVSLAQPLPFEPIGMLLRADDATDATHKLARFLATFAERKQHSLVTKSKRA